MKTIRTIFVCGALAVTAICPALGQADQYQALEQAVAATAGDMSSQMDAPYVAPRVPWVYPGEASASAAARDPAAPVIVQLSPTNAETLAAMSEDLAVMTRVIERGLDANLGKQDKPIRMSVQMLLTGTGRSVRAMHIEGVGALFLIKVNFTLVPPPKQERTPERSTGSEWEEARKDIMGMPTAADRMWRTRGDSGEEYSEAQVEALKAALLAALKQANNIRHLKVDDFITLCVFGPRGSTMYANVHEAASTYRGGIIPSAVVSPEAASRASTGGSAPVRGAVSTVAPEPQAQPPERSRSVAPGSSRPRSTHPENPASPSITSRSVFDARTGQIVEATPLVVSPNHTLGQGTVLTIRVKKTDVDAFAKDELDMKAFQERTAINSYAGAGYSINGVNTRPSAMTTRP